jgi:hypothetical protein
MKAPSASIALDQAAVAALAQKFHHNDFEWIYSSKAIDPDWKTRTDRPLSLGELVHEYLDPEKLIGVGFGQTTKYAAIDLDRWSKNHPVHDTDTYTKLLHTLEDIGLTRYIIIQSSHSRGLYVFFPLPKPVRTYPLAASIRIALIDAGFELKNGQLEIFPNCKRYAKEAGDYSHYKAHRLPLQPNTGSWLMDDDGLNPQPIPDTAVAQINAFLNQWDMAAQGQDMKLLERKLPKLYQKFKASKRKYRDRSEDWCSEEAQKWQKHLELTIQISWTEFGMTHMLLPKFLAYGVVFLKLEGEKLYDWMYEQILNAPGYRQYCRHQHEIQKKIKSWIKTNERTGYYSPYRSYPDRSQPYPFSKQQQAKIVKQTNPANTRRADEAESRIQTAYDSLKHQFTASTKITEMRERLRAKIQEMYGIGVSTDTLSRHRNIWHPEYNIQENTTLSHSEQKCPQTPPEASISQSIENIKNSLKIAVTPTEKQSDRSQIPMICSSPIGEVALDLSPDIFIQPDLPQDEILLEVEEELSTYTKHYTPRPEPVVAQPPGQGKFEVFTQTLSKIATLAALAIDLVLAWAEEAPRSTR